MDEKPDSATMMSFTDESGPRYACLGGLDAFGRVDEGELTDDSPDSPRCTTAYDTPN